jgi:hypothetical protein
MPKLAWMCRTPGCEDEHMDGTPWCRDCRRWHDADYAVALELSAPKKPALALRYAQRRKRGMCGRNGCPHEAIPGMSLCAACAEKGRRKMQTRAEARYACGGCIRCAGPREDEHRLCLRCRAKDRARRAALLVSGGKTQ